MQHNNSCGSPYRWKSGLDNSTVTWNLTECGRKTRSYSSSKGNGTDPSGNVASLCFGVVWTSWVPMSEGRYGSFE